MRARATNRQLKLLRFFHIECSPNLSMGAAGWEIDAIMKHAANQERWRRYLFVTKDFDSDSDQLRPVSAATLEAAVVPSDWNGHEEVQKFRDKLVADHLRSHPPFDDPPPKVTFDGAVFVFTGEFDFGDQPACRRAVVARGGLAPDVSVSQTVDYLVIGEHGSRAWKSENYGNKIAKAVRLRREHGAPAIISESHWTTELRSPSDPRE